MWTLLMITAFVRVRRKAVYWSCLQIPFSGKWIKLHAPPYPLIPRKVWKPWLGPLGEIQVITALLPLTWPSYCSWILSDISLGPSSLFLLRPFKCVKPWNRRTFSQSETLCTSGSTLLQFSFSFFSQSVWVTATWNREENGINMLEMLESDL